MTLGMKIDEIERQRNALAAIVMKLSRVDSALKAKSIDYMKNPAYAELRDAISEARDLYAPNSARMDRAWFAASRDLNVSLSIKL